MPPEKRSFYSHSHPSRRAATGCALLWLTAAALMAAAPAALAAGAEGPLLSGYGGPGAGAQVILSEKTYPEAEGEGGGRTAPPHRSEQVESNGKPAPTAVYPAPPSSQREAPSSASGRSRGLGSSGNSVQRRSRREGTPAAVGGGGGGPRGGGGAKAAPPGAAPRASSGPGAELLEGGTVALLVIAAVALIAVSASTKRLAGSYEGMELRGAIRKQEADG